MTICVENEHIKFSSDVDFQSVPDADGYTSACHLRITDSIWFDLIYLFKVGIYIVRL